MSTNATLNVSVKASTADFEGGMKRINTHLELTRGNISVFAAIAGTSAGPLQHLAHAFEMVPGPIGAMVGALFIAREAWNSYTENLKKVEEEHEATFKAMARFNELAGLGESAGKFTGGLAKAMDTSSEEIDKIFKTMHDDLDSIWSAGGNVKDQLLDIGRLLKQQNKNVPLLVSLQELDATMSRLQDKKFDIELRADSKQEIASLDALMLNAQDEAKALNDELTSGLLVSGTTKYDEVKKALQSAQLAAKGFREEIDRIEEAMDRKSDEALKEKLKKQDELLKQQAEAAKRVRAQTESPEDKLKDKLLEYQKMFKENPFFGPEYFKDAIKNAEDEFIKVTEKADKLPKEHHALAVSHAVNIGSAYVAGLQNRAQNDPAERTAKETEKAVDILSRIEKKLGLGTYAVAQ